MRPRATGTCELCKHPLDDEEQEPYGGAVKILHSDSGTCGINMRDYAKFLEQMLLQVQGRLSGELPAATVAEINAYVLEKRLPGWPLLNRVGGE